MKAIKKIHNNIALCVDDEGREVIAFGKGLGFKPMPYEIKNMSEIERTFYDVEDRYVGLISSISEDIFAISVKIDNYARKKLHNNISVNSAFTLADHIQFAIERLKKGYSQIYNKLYEIENLYEDEYEIGKTAVDYINKKLNVRLPNDEICGIALHYINSESFEGTNSKGAVDVTKTIDELVEIIQNRFDFVIDKKDFNYSRFASHIEYLIKRAERGKEFVSDNLDIYNALILRFPEIFDCVKEMEAYLKKEHNWDLNDEEKLYLMLHVNRLCSRQDMV